MSDYDVIHAIYPDYLATTHDSLVLTVPVELQCTVAIADQQLALAVLPPVVITLAPPTTILSVHSTHNWLADHHLSALTRLLASDPALDSWIESIRTGAFLSHLGLLDASTLALPHATPALIPLLAAHAAHQIQSSFQSSSHRCDICLSHYKGSKCVQLSCAHVFCKLCLSHFWGLCIREGDIARVICPSVGCPLPTPSDHDLSSVLSSEQMHRLQWLTDKKASESDPSIMPCPIQSCQSPVPKSDDNLRQCTQCSYSFCALCLRAWHGPVEPCSTSSTNLSSLISTYVALSALPSQDSLARKSRLERQYGYMTLQRLLKKYEQDQANQKYLVEKTTKCPGKHCSAWVEKNLGCNHITCTQCNAHFCYRCGTTLDPAKPYLHFSTPGMSKNDGCLNRLFDSDEDGEWEVM